MRNPRTIWVVESRWAGDPNLAGAGDLAWTPIFPTASPTRTDARKQLKEEKETYGGAWQYRVVKYTPDHPYPLLHNFI